ncbi:hypothetical protein, partial [Duodenibacillus massiliensis]|uniref:hypothetical protein n=1 Tax=Duodenibacillus massiliensis TaxID=1852381 RepID=UPI003AB74F8B
EKIKFFSEKLITWLQANNDFFRQALLFSHPLNRAKITGPTDFQPDGTRFCPARTYCFLKVHHESDHLQRTRQKL